LLKNKIDCAGVYLCNVNYLDYIEDLGVDMRIILKWMYCTRNGNGEQGPDWSCSG